MKAYGGVDVHIFLTSALVWGEWSASCPDRFSPVEGASGTHWIGDWVDPRAGLDDVEKKQFLTLQELELLNGWETGSFSRRTQLHGVVSAITKFRLLLLSLLLKEIKKCTRLRGL
jgi:hypothetical protein